MKQEAFPYYVDKTGLITELLLNWGEVNLFTRPRRFGKSLNMSMLKYFFSYGCDRKLFDELELLVNGACVEKKIWDTAVRKAQKENFYHGILLGLLSHQEEWDITSNAESGKGYSDILIEITDNNMDTILKYGIACRRKTCMVRMAPP